MSEVISVVGTLGGVLVGVGLTHWKDKSAERRAWRRLHLESATTGAADLIDLSQMDPSTIGLIGEQGDTAREFETLHLKIYEARVAVRPLIIHPDEGLREAAREAMKRSSIAIVTAHGRTMHHNYTGEEVQDAWDQFRAAADALGTEIRRVADL